MDNLTMPKRYDVVSFAYKGESFKGEVQKIEKKPKGYLMLVKLRKNNEYRSCYSHILEQCEDLVNVTNEPVYVINLEIYK